MKPGEAESAGVLHAGKPRVAVVGSGISGLASAWLLREQYAVTLFEAAPRLGGHTNTIDVSVEGLRFPIDTGFLVFNERTYPNLCALFALLDIPAVKSEMTFSASIESIGLEWAGSDLNTLFGQRRNLLRPHFWGMVSDILRFNRETTALADDGLAVLPAGADETLGQFLTRRGYGAAFRDWYLLPMAAAIWSCPTSTMLAYPLSTFVRFCHNHGLLQVMNRPQWMTVRNGGRNYVERMAADLTDIRLSSPVQGLVRDDAGVRIRTPKGEELFDQVVLACHSDQALALMGAEATPAERAILSSIRYQANRAVVHTDASLLPRRQRLWSAWNYAAGPASLDGPAGQPVAVSYLINRLQPLPVETPVLVSLNPFRPPAPEKVLAEIDYAHPVFDQGAIGAQQRLASIQGRDRVWFCGAWGRYGFHEDGLRSAMAVAARMGASIPWGHASEVAA